MDLHVGAGGDQLVQCDLEVACVGVIDGDIPLGDRRHRRPGASDDAVGDGRVLDGVQALNPLHSQGGTTGASDVRTHSGEHLAQVDDFGLAGGVVDDGDTLGQHGSHQQILGCADTGEVQPDLGTVQTTRCRRHQVAVFAGERRPHAFQTTDVHV